MFHESLLSEYGIHFLTAALLGAALGLERELAGKEAGFRTFSLVSLGSCLFTLLSFEAASLSEGTDVSRISAQVVSGVGFLGAGVIFRSNKGVSGLTTAALLWVAAAIGMAVGHDKFYVAFEATLIIVLYMLFFRYIQVRLLGKRL